MCVALGSLLRYDPRSRPSGRSAFAAHLLDESLVDAVVVHNPDPAVLDPAEFDLLDALAECQGFKDDTPPAARASERLAPINDALVPGRNLLLSLIPSDVIKDLVG